VGDVLPNALALRAAKRHDPDGFLQVAEAASPAIGLGAVLTLVSGVGLVLQSDAWRFSMPWIVAGIAMIVIAGTAESVYFVRQLAAIRTTVDQQGKDAPEVAARLERVTHVAAVINALVVVVVWLMVFKPA
jgi:uncharacterized membrane protein